jgi:hypothetical protein
LFAGIFAWFAILFISDRYPPFSLQT